MTAVINFFSGTFGLAGVYILEYFFGFSPCDLCLKQRMLAVLLILFSLVALIFNKYYKKYIIIGNILMIITVLGMVSLAFFQVGVERGFFALPDTCSHGISPNQTIEDLRNSLLNTDSLKPSCDVPQFLFGVSVATLSFVATIFLSIVNIFFGILAFKKNALDNIKR